MTITPIYENKKDYMELLLLADEQEDMINRYLDRGDMFVLTEDDTTGAESPDAEQTATVPANPAVAVPANSDHSSSAPLVFAHSAPTNPQPHSALAECVVTKEADGIYELKNLAVTPMPSTRVMAKSWWNSCFPIILTAVPCMRAPATAR